MNTYIPPSREEFFKYAKQHIRKSSKQLYKWIQNNYQ